MTDTSPTALRAIAEQYAKTSTVPANFCAVLRAIAAEKEAQHHKEQPLNMVPPADVPLPEPFSFAHEDAGSYWPDMFSANQMRQYAEAYAAAAVAAERERCAKLCDLHSRLTWNDDRKTQSRVLAAEIRRGEIQVHQKGTV